MKTLMNICYWFSCCLSVIPRLTLLAVIVASCLATISCGGKKASQASSQSTTVNSSATTSSAISVVSSTSTNALPSSAAASSSIDAISSEVAISSQSSSSSMNTQVVVETSPNKTTQWKRVAALKNDLMYALDLTESQLCSELGTLSCFDQVHLSALGGNEPYVLTQYEPMLAPGAITAVAVERVVLASCSNKVDSDLNNTATIFTEYDLTAMSTPNDDTYLATVDAQNIKLYRRFLARDPSQSELELLQTLTKDDNDNAISNSDVAKLSCFSIASSSEFIFL